MIMDLLKQLATTHISAGQVFLGIFLFITGVFVLFLIFSKCSDYLEKEKRKGYLLVKSLLIALSPILLEIFSLIGFSVPDYIYDILLAVSIGIVVIWNVLSMGVFHGLLYTVLCLALGFIISIGLIIAVVAVVVYLIFGRESKKGTTSVSPIEQRMKGQTDSVPEFLTDVSSGESSHVTTGVWGNDTIYIDGKVVRKVDNNRYIDSDGNYYISYDD